MRLVSRCKILFLLYNFIAFFLQQNTILQIFAINYKITATAAWVCSSFRFLFRCSLRCFREGTSRNRTPENIECHFHVLLLVPEPDQINAAVISVCVMSSPEIVHPLTLSPLFFTLIFPLIFHLSSLCLLLARSLICHSAVSALV